MSVRVATMSLDIPIVGTSLLMLAITDKYFELHSKTTRQVIQTLNMLLLKSTLESMLEW